MNIRDLKPLSQLAGRFGVKACVYGPPGTGKTPIAATAPRPLVLACEPGLLSVKHITNVPGWSAYTPEAIDEFFTWFDKSSEAKNFDTLCIDSASQMAELFLTRELAKCKDGRMAYGNMARRMMEILNSLYYRPETHTYIICKEMLIEVEGVTGRRPYFPGKELNTQVPHMYDEFWHLALTQVPGQPMPVTAFRTRSTFGVFARDRSGKLDELEPPNLTTLFNKCMS